MSVELNRRTVLKGLGCAMGLPLLEAMLPQGRGVAVSAAEAGLAPPHSEWRSFRFPTARSWMPGGPAAKARPSNLAQPCSRSPSSSRT